MSEYLTRMGTSRRGSPANQRALYGLPSRMAEDDGKIILHAGDCGPTCPDCGKGTLQWAEAGYVSWHRICDRCGSHWDLHPVCLFLVKVDPRLSDPDPRVKVLRGDIEWALDLRDALMGKHDDDEDAKRVYALADMVTPEHVRHAVAESHGGVPCVGTCWAQRARFYSGAP